MLMFLQESGVDLLSIRGTDPSKYALQLMDILFTDQEMVYKEDQKARFGSCQSNVVRS